MNKSVVTNINVHNIWSTSKHAVKAIGNAEVILCGIATVIFIQKFFGDDYLIVTMIDRQFLLYYRDGIDPFFVVLGFLVCVQRFTITKDLIANIAIHRLLLLMFETYVSCKIDF